MTVYINIFSLQFEGHADSRYWHAAPGENSDRRRAYDHRSRRQHFLLQHVVGTIDTGPRAVKVVYGMHTESQTVNNNDSLMYLINRI